MSYPTAWYMLHRLRILYGGGMEALRSTIEVDETYIGSKEANKHESKKLKAGRGPVGKAAILDMRERGGKVKAAPVDKAEQSTTVAKAIHCTVETGSATYTYGASAYNPATGMFYEHESVNHSAGKYVSGKVHANSIERVWTVLKQRIPQHLSRMEQAAHEGIRQ